MTTKNQETSLPTHKANAITALLSGMTKAQAAAAAGVIPRTLSRWLSEDDFKAELDKQTSTAVNLAGSRLSGALHHAIEVMIDVMTNDDVSDKDKLRAANMVASHALRYLEMVNMQRRLEELEAKVYGT